MIDAHTHSAAPALLLQGTFRSNVIGGVAESRDHLSPTAITDSIAARSTTRTSAVLRALTSIFRLRALVFVGPFARSRARRSLLSVSWRQRAPERISWAGGGWAADAAQTGRDGRSGLACLAAATLTAFTRTDEAPTMTRSAFLIPLALLLLLLGCATSSTDTRDDDQRWRAHPRQEFLLDADSTADITTADAQDSSFRRVCWQVIMAATGSPVGTWQVQGSIDGEHYFPIYLDALRVFGVNFETFEGGTDISVSSPGGTVQIATCVGGPPPRVRLHYARQSGGAAAAVDVFASASISRSN